MFAPSPENPTPSKPVRTGAHPFEQNWMTVEQAVVFCAERGLTRTPKTLRKWAVRSNGISDGEVVARKEDTAFGGYRWQIEVTSLARKVDEELAIQRMTQAAPVQTGANMHAVETPEIPSVSQANPLAPVQTGADLFEPVRGHATDAGLAEPHANPSEAVQTSTHWVEPVHTSELERVLDEVRERIGDKDRQIAFLEKQLEDAQAEIGRRARSTDEALKTIDRVVRSFEMQAEANKALALGGGDHAIRHSDAPKPVSFTPSSVDNATRHVDIRQV